MAELEELEERIVKLEQQPQLLQRTDPAISLGVRLTDLAEAPLNHFNVLDYGARADGLSDDTKTIQRAVDAANDAGGGTVYLPAGTYHTTDEVRLYTGVHIRGEGHESVIDWKGTDTVQANGRRKCPFLAYGSRDAAKDLTVTATDGATSLTVAGGDEAGFAAGDYIHVMSNEIWDTEDQNKRVGEIAQVLSTAAGTINLTDPLFDGYATGDSARVAKLNLTSNIVLQNFRIVGDFQGAENDQAGVTFSLCKNVQVTNVRSEDVGNYHFQFLGCVDVVFVGNSTHRAEKTGQGYGVTLGGCQFVTIEGNNFYGGRHSISNGAHVLYTADASDTTKGLINRVHSYIGNTCWDSESSAIGSHSAAEYVSVVGNVVHGGGSFGISSRGPNWVVVGNIIHRAPGGIVLSNYTDDRRCTYIIADNEVHYPTSTGIGAVPIASASTNNVGWVIEGNTVMQGGSAAVAIQVGAAASSVPGAVIRGNTVWQTDSAATGIRCDNLIAPAITGNSVYQTATQANPLYRLDNVSQFTFTGNVGRAGSDIAEVLDCNNCDEGAISGNTFNNGTHGIALDANSTNCAIVGNNFNGFGTAYISNAGAGMKVAHNVGSAVHTE